MSADDEVHAAGAVVRDEAGRIVVVHRPRRSDWSLPKGKHEPGESDEEAAHREVLEETGIEGDIVGDLGEVRYRDHRGRAKRVRYFRMVATSAPPFEPNAEVDDIRWVTADEAVALLTYPIDRDLVRRAAASSGD